MSYPSNTIIDCKQYDIDDVAFIALGSNLPSSYGTSVETLQQAANYLQKLSQRPLLRSSTWLSEPIGCPTNSPKFANAVVGLYPQQGESPVTLLAKILDLETVFGRQRGGVVNEPRILDLDLITFGAQIIVRQDLTIPHPAAQKRAFVLFPLEEIAPGLVIPGQDQSVTELAEILRLSCPDIVKIFN
jgi:2-amino-4-hydroxy-6-hydroxymethyldihydropteridine diphosphokinase